MPTMVLVIDDNEMNRELLLTMLDRMGLDCVTRADGLSGLQALDEQVFALVLVDLKLPDMDGFDVVRAIRKHEQNAGARVLLISGAQMVDDQVKDLCTGCDGYLAKPFTFDQLAAAVREQLDQRVVKG